MVTQAVPFRVSLHSQFVSEGRSVYTRESGDKGGWADAKKRARGVIDRYSGQVIKRR